LIEPSESEQVWLEDVDMQRRVEEILDDSGTDAPHEPDLPFTRISQLGPAGLLAALWLHKSADLALRDKTRFDTYCLVWIWRFAAIDTVLFAAAAFSMNIVYVLVVAIGTVGAFTAVVSYWPATARTIEERRIQARIRIVQINRFIAWLHEPWAVPTVVQFMRIDRPLALVAADTVARLLPNSEKLSRPHVEILRECVNRLHAEFEPGLVIAILQYFARTDEYSAILPVSDLVHACGNEDRLSEVRSAAESCLSRLQEAHSRKFGAALLLRPAAGPSVAADALLRPAGNRSEQSDGRLLRSAADSLELASKAQDDE